MENTLTKEYPTREMMCEYWEKLAADIFETQPSLTESPDSSKSNKDGFLTIIGSGIQSLGFSMNDIKVLEDADKVFYCIADPATIVWIMKLRPDAYDLYTLYDDNKDRYYTYMQMTEAMLYYVRQGKKVVSVFYGHPGVFVLSTHRAIAIAKREGLNAEMRAGISALDCLCADLGVDPSHPGMQTFEATDMLVRLRQPDTSLHVVLWQVGLIAEMGYRRGGFINNNFVVLIEYLQKYYGDDFEITHYIASRYPTIPPKIEKYKLSELLDPRNRSKMNGLSTFYVPPKDAVQADIAMCIKLGLAQPGQSIRPVGTLRDISSYKIRELRAVDLFNNFQVPDAYQYQSNTSVSEFLIALSQSASLQQLYLSDPVKAIKGFPALSEKDKEALITRHEGKIQIAAKGSRLRSSEQERFIMKMLVSKKIASSALLIIQKHRKEAGLTDRLELLAKNEGFDIKWRNIPPSVDNVYASSLLPWTTVYGDVSTEQTLLIIGNNLTNAKSLIYLGKTAITNFTFNNYTLMWKKSEGNATSGCLKFSFPQQKGADYIRKVAGKVWTDLEPQLSNFNGIEQILEERFIPEVKNAGGDYFIRYNSKDTCVASLIVKESNLLLDQTEIPYIKVNSTKITFGTGAGTYPKGEITFLADPFTNVPSMFGTLYMDKASIEPVTFYGVKQSVRLRPNNLTLPGMPSWVVDDINAISQKYNKTGGLFFYSQYVKARYTGKIITQVIRHSKQFLSMFNHEKGMPLQKKTALERTT